MATVAPPDRLEPIETKKKYIIFTTKNLGVTSCIASSHGTQRVTKEHVETLFVWKQGMVFPTI